jgi:hypothetical protein
MFNVREKIKFNQYDVIFASHIYPLGASWLINALLGLEICVKAMYHPSGAWNFTDKNRALTTSELCDDWMSHIPILYGQKEFTFRENITIGFTHNLPDSDLNFYNKKVILMVRDFRDTIYSRYKRNIPDESISLDSFINNTIPEFIIFEVLSIFKTQFWLDKNNKYFFNSAYRLALWISLWKQVISPERLLIIRFEDIKNSPENELLRVLNFIGVARNKDELEFAIKESDFQKAKAVEEKIKNIKLWKTINRKGAHGEWESVYDAVTLKNFDGLPSILMKELGYDNPVKKDDRMLSIQDTITLLKGKYTQHVQLINFFELLLYGNNNAIQYIPTSLISLYTEYFTIKDKIDIELKELIIKIFTALIVSFVYTKNSTDYSPMLRKFDYNNLLIFRSLIVCFYTIDIEKLLYITEDKISVKHMSLRVFLN